MFPVLGKVQNLHILMDLVVFCFDQIFLARNLMFAILALGVLR
jgi:hypothetical protein